MKEKEAPEQGAEAEADALLAEIRTMADKASSQAKELVSWLERLSKLVDGDSK